MEKVSAALPIALLLLLLSSASALALTVEDDFPGASVRVVASDDAAQSLGITPKQSNDSWWYFRVTDLNAAQPLKLSVRSTLSAEMERAAKSLAWSAPNVIAWSKDGKDWQFTAPGTRTQNEVTYEIPHHGRSLLVAWGPPYTFAHATAYMQDQEATRYSVECLTLPLDITHSGTQVMRICEGDRVEARRIGIWVQGRSSPAGWVCHGFAEWLLGDSAEAIWLRQHAEIFIAPVADSRPRGGEPLREGALNRDDIVKNVKNAERQLFYIDIDAADPSNTTRNLATTFNILPHAAIIDRLREFLKIDVRDPRTVKGRDFSKPFMHTFDDENPAIGLRVPWNADPPLTVKDLKEMGQELGEAIQKVSAEDED